MLPFILGLLGLLLRVSGGRVGVSRVASGQEGVAGGPGSLCSSHRTACGLSRWQQLRWHKDPEPAGSPGGPDVLCEGRSRVLVPVRSWPMDDVAQTGKPWAGAGGVRGCLWTQGRFPGLLESRGL